MAHNSSTRPSAVRQDSTTSDESFDEPQPARIRGRESLVSLQSYYVSPPLDSIPGNKEAAGSSWSAPFSPREYEPVSLTSDSPPRKSRGKSFMGRSKETLIEDENYDMSLLKGAAPFGETGLYGEVPESEANHPLFDVTSFSGPVGSQDQEFLKKLQEQEASGKLTGGLGVGISPVTRIKGGELLSKNPTVKRSLSRSLTFRQKQTDRRMTMKGMGQSEANKRGEVIEVIMEEPEVDLSNMVGPSPVGLDPDRMRQNTLPGKGEKTQIFYPQPNWKPFPMRWPYLLSLIILSLVLAIVQEVIYQQSARAPLLKFKKPTEITPFDYFVVKFIPTIIAVAFGVLWQIIDLDIMRLEAFYQMSKEGGALAAESLNIDYPTMLNVLRPVRALQRKHYAVALSSITTLLAVSLVPTLGAAAIVLNPDMATRLANPEVEKTITINPVWSRLLTTTLVIIAVMGVVLFYQLQSRRSGLLGDVKGIAGLASMAVVSHIMMDFKDLDVAKPKDIHHRLKNHRYVLRNNSLAPDDENPVSRQEIERYAEAQMSENPHPLILRAEGGIPFIIGILLFFIFIPIFIFTSANDLMQKAPWILTAFAVVIKLSWSCLDIDMRMMEPYYILSKRHAPAKTLTLDYTSMPFAWVAFRALLNKHWMVFLVGVGSILSETLTIFATSLGTVAGEDFIDQIRHSQNDHDGTFLGGPSPDNPNKALDAGQETVLSFTVSLAFTCFILLYMFVVATVVFVRRRHPFLPRQPNTIASALAFMHQSKMLYDFVGTAKFTNAQMVERLESIGKTYGLGIFEGRDGLMHCGVDEEELKGNYKHGVDFSLSNNKPWDREWQLF